MTYITKLQKLDGCKKFNVCKKAIAWLEENNFKTLNQAWQVCERGDWMLWLLGKLAGKPGTKSRKKLAYTAACCAELALPIFEKKYPNDDRPRKSIEAAKKGSVKACRDDSASALAYSAATYSATNAAIDIINGNNNAAINAAAAHAAAYAASWASNTIYAYAAAAACNTATYVDYAITKGNPLKECADIVRHQYPKAPKLNIKD